MRSVTAQTMQAKIIIKREMKGVANTKCDPTNPQKNLCIEHSYLNVLLVAIVNIIYDYNIIPSIA